MRRFWHGALAPLIVVAISMGMASATLAESRGPVPTKDETTVELFDAIATGEIEVKVIAKDATTGKVFIKNTTKKRLTIKLPEAFAAVPVAAQIGGNPFGPAGAGLNGNINGGGFPGGGGLLGGQGANQAIGGGFPGQQAGNGFPVGGGMPGGAFPAGGLFKVEPEKVGKIKFTSVCLQHGNPDPNPRVAYEIKPIESYTSNFETIAAVRMLGRGEIDQPSAQAAAWHLENGLTWQQLSGKIGVKHFDGRTERFFTRDQVARGQQIAKEAARRADSHSDQLRNDKSESLATRQ